MKPDSFLSKEFLSEFVEKRPTDFFADNFLPWVSLYRFLNSHTDIVLDGEKEDYASLVQTDGLCREIIRRYYN